MVPTLVQWIIILHLCNGLYNEYILEGFANVDSLFDQTMKLEISPSNSSVQLTLTGAEDVWNGFGFNAYFMNGTYAIIMDGSNNGSVYEYVLGYHQRGNVLESTINILSNTVSNGQRTVVLTREIKGRNSSYYSFPTMACQIPIIWAAGFESQPIYNTSNEMEFSGENVIVLQNVTNEFKS